jgi:hypothetical protein
MQYLFLIYMSEVSRTRMSEHERQAELDAHAVFGQEATARGVMVGGEALQPTTTATTVQRRDGKLLIGDGPFEETDEQLVGYYVLNCKDLNEALEMAGKIPGVEQGVIEIRPILAL